MTRWRIVAGCVLIAWACVDAARLSEWQTDRTLWQAEWDHGGEPFRAALGMRAAVLRDGDLEGAILWCRVAAPLQPTDARAARFLAGVCPHWPSR
jgi:hypothetical protein